MAILARRPHRKALLCLALALAGCGKGEAGPSHDAGKSAIGLYSSLPIAWAEAEDIRDALADGAEPHWALATLRETGPVTLLDTLSDTKGALPLPADGTLVLAQPRPLTPQENVALDAWVQAGGRVLLFVDPMLTRHSRFAPGDPRRPQDIAMLSPILSRWGLALEFDDAQATGPHIVRTLQGAIPVDLPGRLHALGKTGDVIGRCRIAGGGIMAECIAGGGRILAMADAALLEIPHESGEIADRKAILSRLLGRLHAPAEFGTEGDAVR